MRERERERDRLRVCVREREGWELTPHLGGEGLACRLEFGLELRVLLHEPLHLHQPIHPIQDGFVLKTLKVSKQKFKF